jgi:predicted enzyme related to lactoylglutathione lyase
MLRRSRFSIDFRPPTINLLSREIVMADNTVRGRFVWHELMTPDTSGAHAFYSKVLGWKTQPWEHDPSYQMFAAASGPLGGSVQATGAPHWLHYIGTSDIDATVAQVKSRGGSVKKDVTSMPNGGKYAVLADPQGAAFGVYYSPMDGGKESPPKRGEFSWHELATTDWQGAVDFYSAVFGWTKMAEHDMGAMGKYVLFGSNGVQRGGMFNKPAEMPGGPAWLGYVRVKDVNEAVKKTKGARGTLVNGPMEVPGGDWIAQFVDPYGAMFAVHTLAADLKPAQPAAAPAAAPAAEAPAASAKPAAPKKAAAKTAPAKKAPAKKAPAKKAPAKKKAAKKKAAKKKAAAKGAKRPARKAAKKKAGRKAKKSGGKRKAARKARKGK